MGEKLAERMRRWIESRHVVWGVFAVSFAETTVLPVPIEVVLIPVMLTNHRRLWHIAAFTLAGCLVGASVGYLIGLGAYEVVGQPFIELVGATEQFGRYKQKLADDGFWYVLMLSITPVPFQIAYLGAGVVKMSYPTFLASAALGRGLRYFGLALLVAILGRAAAPWLEQHKTQLAIWVTVIFIGGYTAYELVW